MLYGNYKRISKTTSRHDMRVKLARRTAQDITRLANDLGKSLIDLTLRDSKKGVKYGKRKAY